MRILIFGDNIAHGFWDPAGGWPQRIRSDYDTKSMQNLGDPYPDMYNLSVAGDTADGVAKRLALEARPRQLPNSTIIIIAVGINDAMVYEGVARNSTELFLGELQQIRAAANQFTDKIIFVGLTAVEDNVCDPWKFGGGKYCFSNERVLLFDDTLRAFCDEHKLPYVHLYGHFQTVGNDKKLLTDGLHPNAEGHQLIADLVKAKLDGLVSA